MASRQQLLELPSKSNAPTPLFFGPPDTRDGSGIVVISEPPVGATSCILPSPPSSGNPTRKVYQRLVPSNAIPLPLSTCDVGTSGIVVT